jgi:hypothetical protein
MTTHLKNPTTHHVEAARFLESLGQVNPRLETIDVRYGTYWTGIVNISWRRRALQTQLQILDLEKILVGDVNIPSTGDNITAPLISRSNTTSSLSSIRSDSSQAAVERFFALPPKPKSTTTIRLPLGDMIISEQRRAGVLPDKTIPFQVEKEVSGLGWLAGGVNRFWYLVGSVRRILGWHHA